MQYHVCFNGQLVERTRLDGWPKVVKDQFIYECDSDGQLADYLNKKAKDIQIRGGLHIVLDKDELECVRSAQDMKTDPVFGYGYFIPLHMIGAVYYTIRRLAGQLPTMDQDTEGILKQ